MIVWSRLNSHHIDPQTIDPKRGEDPEGQGLNLLTKK